LSTHRAAATRGKCDRGRQVSGRVEDRGGGEGGGKGRRRGWGSSSRLCRFKINSKEQPWFNELCAPRRSARCSHCAFALSFVLQCSVYSLIYLPVFLVAAMVQCLHAGPLSSLASPPFQLSACPAPSLLRRLVKTCTITNRCAALSCNAQPIWPKPLSKQLSPQVPS
jgi:hypothetical protein